MRSFLKIALFLEIGASMGRDVCIPYIDFFVTVVKQSNYLMEIDTLYNARGGNSKCFLFDR